MYWVFFVSLQCNSLNQGRVYTMLEGNVGHFRRYQMIRVWKMDSISCETPVEWLQLFRGLSWEDCELWLKIRGKWHDPWMISDRRDNGWITAQILMTFHERIWQSLLFGSHSPISKINSQDSLAQLCLLHGNNLSVLYSNRHNRNIFNRCFSSYL